MILRIFLIYISLFFLSCQSFHKLDQTNIPLHIKKRFGQCRISSGSEYLSIYRLEQKIYTSDLDWDFTRDRLVFDVYSPMGSRFARFSFLKKKISISGNPSVKAIKLDIDKNGFIQYRGFTIGLLPEELGCLVSRKFPLTWLTNIDSYQENSLFYLYKVKDKNRDLTLKFYRKDSLIDDKMCAELVSWIFWPIKKFSVNFCIKEKKAKILEITSDSNIKIKMHQIEQ